MAAIPVLGGRRRHLVHGTARRTRLRVAESSKGLIWVKMKGRRAVVTGGRVGLGRPGGAGFAR